MLLGLYDKNNCCGCRACEEICPRKAVLMLIDDRGFIYPDIEKNRCVSCGLCERVCPSINLPQKEERVKEAIVGVHNDVSILEKSSSGGAFGAIIEAWNGSEKGYVAGVRWNKDFSVSNDISNEVNIIQQFSKSKYILSDTAGIFMRAKGIVLSGQPVLFSGTPCQVAAFRNILGREYDNLLLVDIVCHGAPSSALLKMHITELEKRKGKDIVSWTFRDKIPRDGKISSRSARVIYEDGSSEHFEIDEDAYLKLYYSRMAYRESCGNCRFASPERGSDITICDAHHIEELYSDLSVEKGTSIILFHTNKGLQLKSKISELMTLYSVNYEWVVEHNEQLRKPTDIHPNTKKFYKALRNNMSFDNSVMKYTKNDISQKLKNVLLRIRGILN